MKFSRQSSGSPDLDDLLGGGLERRILIQFYGESGSGKSTACISAAVECLRKKEHVVYIDTEGFSAERFSQIAGDEAEILAEGLFLFEPLDFTQQGMMIADCDDLLEKGGVGLIVLDSATGLYRTETGGSGEVQRRLGQQMLLLLGYARKYDIPVIVTNQVFMDINNDRLKGLGGTGLRHLSKVIVHCEREGEVRRMRLEKHRSRPEGTCFDFLIEEKGIKKVLRQ